MTLLHIISNPRILAKLHAEIDSYLKANPSARDHAAIISSESAKTELPYLQCCIHEGLRIFPPVTGLVAKTVPPNGDTLAGRHVPGGTKIAVSVWAIQRDKVYGETAEIFERERWLESGEERKAKMLRALECVFGVGRYKCLGGHFSHLNMEKVLFELSKRFEFTILNPPNPVKSTNIMFFSQSDMWMRIVRRGDGGDEA